MRKCEKSRDLWIIFPQNPENSGSGDLRFTLTVLIFKDLILIRPPGDTSPLRHLLSEQLIGSRPYPELCRKKTNNNWMVSNLRSGEGQNSMSTLKMPYIQVQSQELRSFTLVSSNMDLYWISASCHLLKALKKYWRISSPEAPKKDTSFEKNRPSHPITLPMLKWRKITQTSNHAFSYSYHPSPYPWTWKPTLTSPHKKALQKHSSTELTSVSVSTFLFLPLKHGTKKEKFTILG